MKCIDCKETMGLYSEDGRYYYQCHACGKKYFEGNDDYFKMKRYNQEIRNEMS